MPKGLPNSTLNNPLRTKSELSRSTSSPPLTRARLDRGLARLAGDVKRFRFPPDRAELKVPHMGWNRVHLRRRPPIFAGVDDESHFYFVHSYYVRPSDPSVMSLSCHYGHDFCAMVTRDNLFATQFHPEKSQANGLHLLRCFNELATRSHTRS